jgi:hydroxyethylthiazole kinase-like uncharacterized protein yjeF
MGSTHALPTPTSELPRLAVRADTTHKGDVGRVAIVAGSRGMSGAAVLCGLGALRGGAGLVRVYTAASAQPIVASAEPSLMTVPVPESELGNMRSHVVSVVNTDWPDVLAIGPGIGQSSELAKSIMPMIDEFRGPVVLDADALNNVVGRSREDWLNRRSKSVIITPHPGEMERLRRGMGLGDESIPTDDDARLRVGVEFARLTETTVVLKGHATVVCTADQAYVNRTGNPGMASGGMGDVLTGLIAALLGQGLTPFDAARLAVHVHGAAADRLALQIGPLGYLAREVADAIPVVLSEFTRPQMGFR